VHPSRRKRFGSARKPPTKKFRFEYKDLAAALNCTVEAARKRVQRGEFEPSHLPTLLEQFFSSRLADLYRFHRSRAHPGQKEFEALPLDQRLIVLGEAVRLYVSRRPPEEVEPGEDPAS
jgi:hypothetical protein